jgi:hypothetical protein
MDVLKKNNLKLKIFSDLDQVDLFAKYLGIGKSLIEECLEKTSKKISNPKRTDPTPSVGFKWIWDKETHLEKIKMHDFGDTYWRGDIIDIAGKCIASGTLHGKNFIDTCNHILNLAETNTYYITPTSVKPTITKTHPPFIAISPRDFTKDDLIWWKKNKSLDVNDLTKGNIVAVDAAWLSSAPYEEGDLPIYNYYKNDRCFAYYLGNIQNINIFKLYFIDRGRNGDTKARFITNNVLPLEGIFELDKADALVIMKSRSDALLLRKILNESCIKHLLSSTGELQITVTNFTSETIRLNSDLAKWLTNRYTYIFTNNDFDREGIRGGKYHLRKYGMQPLFLTNGKLYSIDYHAKDLTDYSRNHGYTAAINLVFDNIERIINELKTVNTYYYDTSK